ncbi:MAG: hypothetical protein CMF12_03785 [Idiomarina sp.]|uniref:FlgO family outer membrane protein n=1 Tax=Idiomarina sp. TaxID=1874361 RepID=UPI000C3E788A|nr:FlgO family outer membrane protein [Idiomarina sp.]MBT41624.1 hypothetical protein [Idiomarina sp.]
MNRLMLLLAGSAFVLSACTVLPKPEPKAQLSPYDKPFSEPGSAHYVNAIAEQLAHNATIDLTRTTIGVTTFSNVTSDYNEGTPFAQTLAQQLMTEMHRSDLPLMDFKTTDFIRVTEDGDFALTRDYLELDEIIPISHVVVGTWAQHRTGVMVSARLVDINSKDVVSVAQTFIPQLVVRQLSEQGDKAIIRKAP